MLPHFADIFQQGNRWLNWLEKQPEGSGVRLEKGNFPTLRELS
ncbi:hypothetical protein T654_04363 [Escherichia coli K02]|nr:hypothetical protein T654_04363 [Escherichia coli K02]